MIVASLRGTCVTPIAFEPNTKAEENACVHKHTRAYAQTGAGRDGKGWSGRGSEGTHALFCRSPCSSALSPLPCEDVMAITTNNSTECCTVTTLYILLPH
ncbi:hypothetical protein LSM04_001701 [Trypanosoma melophagium]|uniref:uncharacterized protein n=1 Tax=Trypanosoma melophagium TaxID=715481 RepID=UPI00351A3102|nr:hypothetical protein LSM04_001701 [Trypanosoma melophagium]